LAQRMILVCDKCDQEKEDVTTHTITLDGQSREVELCEDDVKLVSDLVELGRSVSSYVPKTRATGTPKPSSGLDLTKIREWAKANPDKAQYKDKPWYAEKGRIPDHIIDAYKAA
jgi:Lsr2 protein